MSRVRARHRTLAIAFAVVLTLVVPSAAHGWVVEVHVHGAGAVDEVTDARLMDCETGVDGKSNASESRCVAGSPTGGYGNGWVVDLQAWVPPAHHSRGWRFEKWVDGEGHNQINCDPQDFVGDQTSPSNCKFQIFGDRWVHLYFRDVAASPMTSLIGSPAYNRVTSATSASFDFDAAADPDSGYECQLERPDRLHFRWEGCGSPRDESESYDDLTVDGRYTLNVRSVDPSGNRSGPVSWTWIVDATGPTTSVSSGPSGPTASTSASFGFSASGDAVGFECRLEPGRDWEPCSSGKTYSPLAPGTYIFAVRARDALGNIDGTPATRTFTVDFQPPDTSIESGPSGETASGAATFTFSATEPGATFECRLDDGPWETCASGKTYSGLGSGLHTFHVRARDQAGNTDASEASRTWMIVRPAAGAPADAGIQDAAPPRARLLPVRQRLGRALRRGLRSSASTSEAGTLRVDVLYRGKRVGWSVARPMTSPGAARLTARFARRARQVLGRLRSVRLTLRLTATDRAGNVTVETRRVKLRR